MYLLKYIKPFKTNCSTLFIVNSWSCNNTGFPILTQRLIDDGVNKKDINIIGYILLAQLAFTLEIYYSKYLEMQLHYLLLRKSIFVL